VAAGTGFAPIRSVLESVADERDAYGAVRALVGVRTELDLSCWKRELARWERLGIFVHHVISQPNGHWSGRAGHVQEHLDTLALVEDGVAFLCGQREMVADVRAALTMRGLGTERVFLNLPA
jgi:NAD(P)H-flavin reductase